INGLSANSNTPTGRSYATTISYLMGTSTKDISNGGWSESDSLTKSGDKYQSPSSLSQTDDIKKCSGQGIYVLTDGEPNKGTTTNLSRIAIGKTTFPECTGTSP